MRTTLGHYRFIIKLLEPELQLFTIFLAFNGTMLQVNNQGEITASNKKCSTECLFRIEPYTQNIPSKTVLGLDGRLVFLRNHVTGYLTVNTDRGTVLPSQTQKTWFQFQKKASQRTQLLVQNKNNQPMLLAAIT